MKLSVPIYQLKRQAKLRARQDGIALNAALNSVANTEGYPSWSALAAAFAKRKPVKKIFDSLHAGDLVLLGARPGHGKTVMGIELALEALNTGRQAAFFSLEYTRNDVLQHIAKLGADTDFISRVLTLDTTDNICADHVINRMKHAPKDTVIIIDYLQLLDQNRTTPPLMDQVSALKSFANATGAIVVTISQIDRAYDPAAKPVPDIGDVRLPNQLDLGLFTKTVFLNDGSVELRSVG